MVLALAFVAPSAMAAEFGVSLDTRDDVSTADGFQVDRPIDNMLMVTVMFDQAVVLPAANVTVDGFEMDGDYIPGVMLAATNPISPTTAANSIMLKIKVTAETAKVTLKIAKGIASASFTNEDISKELKVDVHLVGTDDAAGPKVYSIRREIPSSIPVTAATLNVIITLSEMPKEFKKDHVAVDNATHGDPVALTPIAEETESTLTRGLLATEDVKQTPARVLYNTVDVNGDGDADDPGIHAAILENTPKALTDAVTAYNTEAAKDDDVDEIDLETVLETDPQVTEYVIPVHPILKTYTLAVADDGAITITYPTVPDADPDADPATTPKGQTEVADVLANDRTAGAPTKPKPADYANAADYAAAERFYTALKMVHDLYQAELKLRKAYDDAVMAEKDKDTAIRDMELAAAGVRLHRATGRTRMLYPYALTITPKYENKNDIVVKVKAWEDTNTPANKYNPADMIGMAGYDSSGYRDGVNKLIIKVGKEDLKAKALGVKFALPKDKVIPAGGYLVVAEEKAGSSVHVPGGDIDKSPAAHQRNAKELLYNVIDDGDLPNLETHLLNGGIIDVMGPHGLVISEIMWGSDRSLDDPGKSQWIELYNAGAEYKTQDGTNTTYLIFYDGTDTLPAATTVKDRIGTTDALGLSWNLAGKGRSGRTAEKVAGAAQVVATEPLISMYRVMTAGTVANGRMATSWMQSTLPSSNFESNRLGVHIGTPGAATVKSAAELLAEANAAKAAAAAADAATAAAAAKTEATGTIPTSGKIYISEVMFAGEGRLPQWIEIANGSRTEEINLAGWTLTVDNATADADVSVSTIQLALPSGTMIAPMGQNDKPSTVLVVTTAGRTNLTGPMASGQVVNLWNSNQDDLILADVTSRRYTLLSDMAFQITLAPPAPVKTVVAATATVTEKAAAKAADARAMLKHRGATDTAGNLGADGAAAWALPVSDGGRSSIIRAHIPVSVGPAEPEGGMMADSWALASDTSFAQATHLRASSYYGAPNDQGTPGFRAGGALPVELSHFSPARDKVTGAAVITWSTQSELNNAGFFIKRSQQADGEFKVINTTMIPGAGTTSEKQLYTYTDTTANPNIVYYYQIEDVSLDGQRQTLTRGIRLKGHVGAAGKATILWGEIKSFE